MSKPKIGLIGLVGEDAEKDFWGTMQRVAQIGYQGIESPSRLLEGDVKGNLQRFHELGLKVITLGTSREMLKDKLPKVISDAKALESPHVSVWWGPCDSRSELLQDAELYNTAGAELAKEGIKLCYHNHEHEFRTVFNGVYALDVLADHTDPASLYFELDIAWITFGGEDPARVLNRMAGRVPAIHVKDLYSITHRDMFTAVGTGLVRIKEAVQTAESIGVEWIIVEQDKLRNLNAMETVTLSYLNLRESELI